jgi:hypothetical protein
VHCVVFLPARWVGSEQLELALTNCGGPHVDSVRTVTFQFPHKCKVMVDAGVRLLSIANQLNLTTRRVVLNFEEGETGTMGYLNRMGFFDHLAKEIVVFPQRPTVSGAKTYGGTNSDLVEIAKINPTHRDQELPTRLSNAVASALRERTDVKSIEGAIWTVFAELIDNIFSHSATLLDGYAAMQLYKNGNSLQVVVSDSGMGIMHTLRPTLQTQFPALAGLSDIDLLVEVFRQGISRHGPDRGCGLKGSAEKAMKFNADLEVRLPQSRVLLVPANGVYKANTAYCYENLPLLWGTHISFKFHLDTRL